VCLIHWPMEKASAPMSKPAQPCSFWSLHNYFSKSWKAYFPPCGQPALSNRDLGRGWGRLSPPPKSNRELQVASRPSNACNNVEIASRALTAPRWFEFYRKPTELGFLMDRWCEAIQRDPTFCQQIDPLTGNFTQATDRLHSVGLPGDSPHRVAPQSQPVARLRK
jgi:hypothetical protein